MGLNKVAVIGAGSMGSGIAQLAATAGHEVYLYDAFDGASAKALQSIQHFLNRGVQKGDWRIKMQKQSLEESMPLKPWNLFQMPDSLSKPSLKI